MKILSAIFAVLALAPASPVNAMSNKPKVTLRFHAETNSRDGDTYAVPARLEMARRDTHIKRVPEISERNVLAVHPFRAANGSWGCAFKLNESGRIRLETLSTEARGAALVCFIGTKKGQHQVVDMVIDRPVRDGVIYVPHGITDIEIAVLRNQFTVLGEEKPTKKKEEEKKEDPVDWRINHRMDRRAGESPRQPQPQLPPVPDIRPGAAQPVPAQPRKPSSIKKPREAELDLPRIAD